MYLKSTVSQSFGRCWHQLREQFIMTRSVSTAKAPESATVERGWARGARGSVAPRSSGVAAEPSPLAPRPSPRVHLPHPPRPSRRPISVACLYELLPNHPIGCAFGRRAGGEVGGALLPLNVAASPPPRCVFVSAYTPRTPRVPRTCRFLRTFCAANLDFATRTRSCRGVAAAWPSGVAYATCNIL